MTSMEAMCAEHRSKLKAEPYATIIPDRRPAVKCHAHIGLAKLAIAYESYHQQARGGELYELTDDGWKLLYRVEACTPVKELPWRAE
jgi:hydroxypyruvate isomerase